MNNIINLFNKQLFWNNLNSFRPDITLNNDKNEIKLCETAILCNNNHFN